MTTFGFVPQVVKILRSKSSKDVSLITLIQFSLGTSLWAIYGYYIKDTILVVANTVSWVILLIALIFYFKYK